MNPGSFALSSLATALALATLSHAQDVTVTTLNDVSDFGGPRTLVDLPGPDGVVSFREALEATNNTPGPQTIAFAIPQEEWWLLPDVALLRLEQDAFLVLDDATTIDFSTQTAFTGDTNPDGPEVGIYGLQPNGLGVPAILVIADDCVLRGLGPVYQRGASIAIWEGDRNHVVGCVTESVEVDPYPGTGAGNVIGGTAPGDGNVLDTVSLFCGASDSVVIGNRLRTVQVIGSPFCPEPYPTANRIGGPTPAERNVLTGAGSYGSEGFPSGFNIKLDWARDTRIEGNYVGVAEDGVTRVPQVGPYGIAIRDSIDTVVRDNVIAGQWVEGVNHAAGRTFGQAIGIEALNADNVGVVIEGNRIGTDASGTQGLLTRSGIVVRDFTQTHELSGIRIGGSAPGQGNTIAYTERGGVAVVGNARAEISGNSIRENGLLGIDLTSPFVGAEAADGVTPNDVGDADMDGGNALQNFPELFAATTTGTSLHVGGLLDSRPGHVFRLEFFVSALCDPSGHGEGESFLGSTEVVTSASGRALFQATLASAIPVGAFVTATATDVVLGTTSEFSACRTVAPVGPPRPVQSPEPSASGIGSATAD